jgi:hypothetical protein
VPHTSTSRLHPTENQNGLEKKYLPNQHDKISFLLQ